MTMPNREHDDSNEQIELERMLFRYSMALERGDFDTVASILEAAEGNPALNRMIQELDMAYTTDPDLNPDLVGEHTMAQLTRPLILPQKPKQAVRSGRSSLLFPFAAVVAVALVGFSLLSFNPPPQSPFLQGVPPVNLGSETATPVPFDPSVVSTLLPGADRGTSTPTPFEPTFVPTVENPMTFATVVPLDGAESGMPAVIVPIFCEGVTRGTPATELFTRPFLTQREAVLIGLYGESILVPINDVAIDESTGEIWFYVGDANSVVNPGDQGWTHSANIELLPGCPDNLDTLVQTLVFTPTPVPFGMDASVGAETATPFPMGLSTETETATPFPMTATPVPAS